MYRKACVKRPLLNRPKIGFQDQLSLNAGQKYCIMLQGEQSAILLNFIRLEFVIKISVLSSFYWPFYTGFTVYLQNSKRASRRDFGFVCLFDLILYVPSTIFQLNRDGSSLVERVLS